MDPKHEEREIARLRKERAEQLEQEAQSAELDVLQVGGLEKLPAEDQRPGLDLHIEQVTARAAGLRRKANEAHKLAGTSPEDFIAKMRTFLRDRLRGLEGTLIMEREWLAHPSVYYPNTDPTEAAMEDWLAQRRWTIAEIEFALVVMRDALARSEAETPVETCSSNDE